MNARHTMLLTLISRMPNQIVEIDDLMIHAYLLKDRLRRQEVGKDTRYDVTRFFYDFVPYVNGPKSFWLERDIEILMSRGNIWRQFDLIGLQRPPSHFLRDSMNQEVYDAIANYRNTHSTKSLTYLKRKIAQSHQFYSLYMEEDKKNHIILDKDLVRPVGTTHYVRTIGYQKQTIDSFMSALIKVGIERLIDVRHNPVSRKFGFHKKRLASICNLLGIQYIHCPEVGASKEIRKIHDEGDLDKFFDMYRDEVLVGKSHEVERVARLSAQKPSALMCMEYDPSCCHRSALAKDVVRRIPGGGITERQAVDVHVGGMLA